MTTALVVGYGAIGTRHARVLTELGCSTAVVSSRRVDFPFVFATLAEALAVHAPRYVVVANATDQHHLAVETLATMGYCETILVEKPLFDQTRPLPSAKFRLARVAYNLRFHPIVQRLKTALAGENVLSAHAYVGQYLPDWRPGADYRLSYSAKADRGGGVLRDLSHELDYLTWLLGSWRHVTALGGHVSSLEITSDDVFSLLMSMERCPIVSVQLNYLDRRRRRTVLVNTNRHTFEADLVEGTIRTDGDKLERFVTCRDDTYRAMHEAMLGGRVDIACSLDEGMETLRLIDSAILSAQRLEWTSR